MLLSLTWLCRDPGWEPLIAFIIALGVHIGWDGWNTFHVISTHDQSLIAKFRQLIPHDSRTIPFLRDADWAIPFNYDRIEPLFRIHDEWKSADYEFDNKSLKNTWNKFRESNDALITLATQATFPHDGNPNLVTMDFSDCNNPPEKIAERNALNDRSSHVYMCYEDLVRLIRRLQWRAEQAGPGYPPQGVGSPDP